MSELPAAPRNAKALLVKAETYEALRQAAKNQLVPDEEDFITQTRNGKKFVRLRNKTPDPSTVAEKRLPFEIFTRGISLVSHPGTVGTTAVPEKLVATPANGNWFFQARVEVDPDTGVVVTATAEWTQTPTNSTGVINAKIIARITVADGVPNPATIEQYTFGPMLTVTYGGVSEKWNILIY